MAVCVPIVVFFAPMGSLIASHFHRQGINFPLNFHMIRRDNDTTITIWLRLIFCYISVLAALIYILDTIALVTALCVIPMYPNGSPNRIMLVVFLVIGGFIFFGALSKLGEKYSNYMLSNYKDANSTAGTTMLNDEKDEELDKGSADDDNLRKMSLGARAARKV